MKKTLKQENEKKIGESKGMKLSKQIRLYGIPIFSLLLFIGLVLFVVIPEVNGLFESIEIRKQKIAEQEVQEDELSALKTLSEDSANNQDLLNYLEIIIPTAKTEVVSFQQKVIELSEKSNIEVQDVVVGERILVQTRKNLETGIEEKNTNELQLVQIPLQFSLIGEIRSLQNLLSELYNGSDFIVVTEMDLVNSPDGSNTSMNLVLSKYQYLPIGSDEEKSQLLSNVSYKEELNQEVIEFIERKSEF